MPRSNMAALRRKNGVISSGSDDTLPRGNVRDATHLLGLRPSPSPQGGRERPRLSQVYGRRGRRGHPQLDGAQTCTVQGLCAPPKSPASPPPLPGQPGEGEHFPQRSNREVARASRRVMESSAAACFLLWRRRDGGVRAFGKPGPQGLWGGGLGVFHSSIEGMRDCEGMSSGMAGGGRPPRPHAFYSCFLPTCDPLPSLYGNLWGRPQGHMCAPAAGCPGLCLPAACFSNLPRLSPPSLSSS